MDISTALAADLAALTEALDEPGTDIAVTLRKLAVDAGLAVPSYVGLVVALLVGGRRLTFTALEEDVEPEDIRASLRMSLRPDVWASGDPAATTSLVLFASVPGAFTDIAADLTWMTGNLSGLGADGFALDEDLAVPPDPASPSGLRALSLVDQAIGVLIGRGHTPEQAARHLDLLAAGTGVDRPAAAEAILGELNQPG